MKAYAEKDLVKNRAAVLLSGGAEADRRAWASEAAGHFPSPDLVEAKDASDLDFAFRAKNSVVYVPDLGALDAATQFRLMHNIKEVEERPKWVLGLGGSVDNARSKGLVREDLAYWLERSRVDLSNAELKVAIKKRRAKQGKSK